MKLPLYCAVPLSVTLATMGILQCASAASHIMNSSQSSMTMVEDERQSEVMATASSSSGRSDDFDADGIRNNLQNDKKKTMTLPTRNLQSINHAPGSMTDQWVQLGQDIEGYAYAGELGDSVAISKDGSIIAIGAPFYYYGFGCHGRVRIFRHDKESDMWVQFGMIEGEGKYDTSGDSIDMNDAGDVIIIGAPGNEDGGYYAGHVRVYHFIKGQWVQKGQDLDGQENYYYAFGWAVAISGEGDRVAIGGPYNKDKSGGAYYSGYVKVYEYDKSTQRWEQLGGDIFGEREDDESGISVDMNHAGDNIIIGAGGNDGNGYYDAGHARVYHLIEGQWVQRGQDLDGKGECFEFGFAVAISREGSRVVIGGPFNSYSGYVQVYEFDESAKKWKQLGDDILGERKGGFAGHSVGMDDTGDTIIIGDISARDDNGDHDKTGHARIYHLIKGQWVQKGQDLDGHDKGDEFGHAVAISGDGNHAIIGGPHSDSGYVKVFNFPQTSSCDDSPLRILTRKSKKSAKTCDFISNNTDMYCKQKKYKTHCPSSCGVCKTFGSSDSTGIFLFNKDKRDCQWLRDLFASSSFSEISTLCQIDKVNATCRETCSFFVQKCEE